MAARFHLKKIKKYIFISGITVSLAIATIGICRTFEHSIGASATQEQSTREKTIGKYVDFDIPMLYLHAEPQSPSYEGNSRRNVAFRTTPLPATYDSRANGYVSRQEDQAQEGICWAYSFTTTAESYLLRKGLVSSAVELSPKQLDYALAQAAEAFSDSTINKYEDATYASTGEHRSVADGSSLRAVLYLASGKYSLVTDDDFYAKMKLNDPTTLSNFDSYGSFITQYNSAYTAKQKYTDVFDKNVTRYAVIGADYAELKNYSLNDVSEERQSTITKIKRDIQDYGAVAVGTHYNEEKCMYKSGQDYTIIDRTTESNADICNESSTDTNNHAITLVGWDDNWEYTDGNSARTGAFIVQNSYGDEGINYYYAYDSMMEVLSITKMQEIGSSTNVFDLSDATKSINANDYEVTFNYNINSSTSQRINKIAVFTNLMTESSDLGWDVYLKIGNGQYSKVGRINDGSSIGLHSLDNLDIDLNGNFSIKVKYDLAGYTVEGLTPSLFEQKVVPYMTTNVYTTIDSGSQPSPGPTPNTVEDEPTGTITWIQGQEHEVGSQQDLIVKIDYPVELLTGITMDNEELPEGKYKAESGSTVLTIYSAYLDALDEGAHAIALSYSNGKTANTSFTVVDQDIAVPDTSASTDSDNSPESSLSNDANSPVTGGNTMSEESATNITSFVVPISIIALASGCYIFKNYKKVKFERK